MLKNINKSKKDTQMVLKAWPKRRK